MAATTSRQFTLRAARPEDAAAIVDLHAESVRGLASGFYSADIIEKWSPEQPSRERIEELEARLAKSIEVTVLAVDLIGEMAGFGSIQTPTHELQAVYVAPRFARMGVGTMILEALERRAIDFSIDRLHMDASINAEAFYKAAGYVSAGRPCMNFRTAA